MVGSSRSLPSSSQWKDTLVTIGDALGRGGDAEALLADYEQEADRLASLTGGLTVSTIRAYPDSVSVYGPDSFAGVVLADAGVVAQLPDAAPGFAEDLSLEQIGMLTADALIVWTANEGDPVAVEEQLGSSPLGATLPVVVSGWVSFGGPYWIGSGLFAARAVLADLEEALS